MDLTERVAKVIREYDEQGWHRTGTAVDYRSAEWLVARVRDLGVAAQLEPFTREEAGVAPIVAGDTVTVSVAGVGTLTNRVVTLD
jgi:2-keto-4-pentenoate hydratase/2-oxohepta-3-ene-1,7-dioic acid hydratase in catechol pathway